MSDKAHGDINDTLRAEGPHAVRARYDRAPKFNDGKHQQRFTLKPFEAIKLSTAPNYLVKGILPDVGLAVIWGPPKCGKSFWTFDLSMHIALGWQYRGRKVQQGTVVYLALEGGHGFAARVEAWRRRHLANHREPVPFYLLDVPLDLIADHGELIRAIREQLGGRKPAAIMIDTLNRALAGNENDPEDMAKFIKAADKLRAAFGECLIGIVHHCGVRGSRPRGHTSLSGADDVQIAVNRDKDGNIIATVEHMKDGEAGAVIACRLDRIELGLDDDGDPITSCLIIPAEGVTSAKGPKLSDANKLALVTLQTLLAAEGQPPPADCKVPQGTTRVCSAIKWREAFYAAYPTDKPDTKQKAFVRAQIKLHDLGLAAVSSAWAWCPDNPDKSRK